ncbi:multicopper oxidase family protein [Kitasatospora sp. NPDC127111]|uniref:multicopper oxidase family protein n=1 Tax=Kitasatospora sp. NPDC127111 TaxID=3345363 RepID=UPI00362F146A
MRTPTRRALLGAAVATVGSGLLAACSDRTSGADRTGPRGEQASPPAGDHPASQTAEVAAAEARRHPGPERRVRLLAAETRLDLGGRSVTSWAYGDRLPGPEIRVTAGDTLALTLANHLPRATTMHWHGLELRNDMDGVPGLTQDPVEPGASFEYRFAITNPGTYWFHPHTGVQLDRGLYGALIVDDPHEPLRYDKEWVVVLDDWLDGVDGSTPDDVLAELTRSSGGAHGEHGEHGTSGAPGAAPPGPSRVGTGMTSELLGGEAGHVVYPYYLINGRTADSPETFTARPGDRIRIRIVNAGADTAFRVALGGHELTVTHTDGFPVEHTTTQALLIGMGERYDVLVTAGDGVFPLTALAEGKDATALAVLRTGNGAAPPPAVRVGELSGKLVTSAQLSAGAAVRLPAKDPDRTLPLRLTGRVADFNWAFDGRPYDPSQRHLVRQGERVRLVLTNSSAMWHPVHLHGHTFELPGGGPRKDTAIVLPRSSLAVDFDAGNPGQWMLHCHNLFHAESGMMAVLGYAT